MTHSKKLVALAVRDFALPSPRTGSIEPQSGFGRATQEGQAIHLQVQQKRAKADPLYQAEKKLSHEFETEFYRIQVGGRIDGFFANKIPKIEEIKTTFNIFELYKKLEDGSSTHPYCLQLKTYGYIYWLQNQVLPKLSFYLVSTRNQETKEFEIKLDLPEYENWLKIRLDELSEEIQIGDERALKRQAASEMLSFPFDPPRKGQTELMETIKEGLTHEQRMLLQAPTGLGKTIGVLYPVLKEALNRGQKAVYITPKNSQHAVAEDAIERLQANGTEIKSLTITAKSKICFKNEPLCNPEYCEYARDYYSKVHYNKLVQLLSKEKKIKLKTFSRSGRAI